MTAFGTLEKHITYSIDFYQIERANFYAEQLIEYIEEFYGIQTIEILSFDVFDTLLLRNSKYELERYLEMSQQFHDYLISQDLDRFSVWDIYATRLTAFKTCYRTVKPNSTVREGRLIDVLTLMVELLELEPQFVDRLIKIELDYEVKNLRVNPVLSAFLQHPKMSDKKVIFVSDMYLSGEQIKYLVETYHPEVDFFKTYSSADFGLTKSSGLLYEKVIGDLGTNRKAIIHFGDNFHSDVSKAKESGWQAIHLPIPEYELEARTIRKKEFIKSLEEQKFPLNIVY
jgi:predicted HAD superfamily hydrolase